jgi:hypothetical protein
LTANINFHFGTDFLLMREKLNLPNCHVTLELKYYLLWVRTKTPRHPSSWLGGKDR